MVKSASAPSRDSEIASREKAARRVNRLKRGLWVQTVLLSFVTLVSVSTALPLAYFEVTERIERLGAKKEEIQDRVSADIQAFMRTGLSLAGVSREYAPYAETAYYWLALLSLTGSGWLALRRARVAQTVRDQEAEYALLALRTGARPPRPIGCYLRSFNLDHLFGEKEQTLTEQAKRHQGKMSAVQRFLNRIPLERKLSVSFARLHDSPIICSLGRRQQGSGFGRIETSDSDWQSVISTLVEQADFFVLMFGVSAGTSWELDELSKNGLIDRTLFVIPDPAELRSQSGLDAYQLEKDCTQLFSMLSKIGYTPPAFYEEGSAFYFKDKQAVPIYANNAITARAIAGFMANLPPSRSQTPARS